MYELFQKIFPRSEKLVGDPDLYFMCEICSAILPYWIKFG